MVGTFTGPAVESIWHSLEYFSETGRKSQGLSIEYWTIQYLLGTIQALPSLNLLFLAGKIFFLLYYKKWA